MLIVAILGKKGEKKRVISTLEDDSAIGQAVELVKGAMANGKVRAGYVYIEHGNNKPVLVKYLKYSWRGKLKIR